MVYFDICLAYNCVTHSCIDYIWYVCETEIIKCVSRSTVGKAHSSPRSLPRCSVFACWCFWMTPTFKYSFKSVAAGVVLVGAHACRQSWMCVYVIWWGARVRSFSSVKAAALFIRDSSSFTRGKLFANVSNAAEKPLTSEIEIYTVLHNKE